MKKSKQIELNWEQTERLIALALEERNPFEIIKKDFVDIFYIVHKFAKRHKYFYEPICQTIYSKE